MLPRSFIEIQNQILGAAVDVTGAPVSLSYSSNRVPGRQAAYTRTIPVSGSHVAAELERIEIQIGIAGRKFKKVFPPQPNQTYTFTWDGKDAKGRQLSGKRPATIRTTYIYPNPEHNQRKEGTTALGTWNAVEQGLGGWTLGVHHAYDVAGKTLYLGNGQHRKVEVEAGQRRRETGFLEIPSEGGGQLYIFDSTGKHLRTVSTLTKALLYCFQYDEAGYLAAIEDGDGNITGIERDAGGAPIAIVAPYGQRTALSLNADGYLESVTNPAGETCRFDYGNEGLLTGFTDPKGNIYGFTYDELGRLIRREEPDGSGEGLARTRTEKGFVVAKITATGRESTYLTERLSTGEERQINKGCGGAGAIVALTGKDGTETITYPDGSVLIQEEQPDPRFGKQAPMVKRTVLKTPGGLEANLEVTRSCTLTDPKDPLSVATLTDIVNFNGRTSTTTFDAENKQVIYKSPEGRQSILNLDDRGRVVKTEVAGLEPVTFAYDEKGRLLSAMQGNQTILSYSYDEQGRLSSLANAEGNQVHYTYDEVGRIVQTTLPSGRTYKFAYDANSNLTEIVVPSGAVHTLQYNAVNLDLGSTNAENSSTYSEYNLERKPIHKVLPSGRTIKNSYYRDRDLERVSYPEADVRITYISKKEGFKLTRTPINGNTPQEITFSFDAIIAPQLQLMETAIGRQNRQRNSQKLLLNAILPDIGLEKALTRQADGFLAQFGSFSYDRGLITEINYSGLANGCYRYRYDQNFFLVGIKLDEYPEIILMRDADGLMTKIGEFNIERNIFFGAASCINDKFLNVTIEYDAFGRIVNRTHTIKERVFYQLDLLYDQLNRIVQKKETIFDITKTYDYTYNCDGQLAQVKDNGVVVERYSYDGNGNRISSQIGQENPQIAQYDSQDRIVELGNIAYQFDDDGFMTQRDTVLFEYSSRGELIKVIMPDGKIITYAYDGVGRLVARTNSEGTYEYLYGNPEKPFQVTAIREPSEILNVYSYDDFGLLFAMQRDGICYYMATDQLNTPKVVVDATGKPVKVLKYDSFGNLADDSNPDLIIPIGFAGGLTDWETKLVRFGFRDYEPVSGRWTAKDPIGFAAGDSNLYQYVNANPMNLIDSTGENPALAIPVLVGGISLFFPQPAGESSADKCDVPPRYPDETSEAQDKNDSDSESETIQSVQEWLEEWSNYQSDEQNRLILYAKDEYAGIATNTSQKGLDFIAKPENEGLKLKLYNDPVGHCTIGVGHLVHKGSCNGSEPKEFLNGITKERAYEILKKDAEIAAQSVRENVTVPLSQHQFDALVSFTFNVGSDSFKNSTLLKKLNEGKYDEVPNQLNRWVNGTENGKKVKLPGLVNRRNAEAKLFSDGIY